MAHKWTDIRGKFSPEREEEIRKSIENDPAIVSISRFREAQRLTLEDLGGGAYARSDLAPTLATEADLYVSTLRSYLKAMGAELQIKAIFPDGEVLIEQFEDLDKGRSDPAA